MQSQARILGRSPNLRRTGLRPIRGGIDLQSEFEAADGTEEAGRVEVALRGLTRRLHVGFDGHN